jgi:thioredoxin
MAKELSGAEFQTTIDNSEIPVLVDFWAEWCGPCRHQSQILGKWGSENESKVMIAKVNVDQENALAAQFGINSIPTLILFSKGKEVGRVVGVQRDTDLDTLLAKA